MLSCSILFYSISLCCFVLVHSILSCYIYFKILSHAIVLFCTLYNSTIFYLTLLYSIQLQSVLVYSLRFTSPLLFYPVALSCIVLCSIQLYAVPLRSILFYSLLFGSIALGSIPFCRMLFRSSCYILFHSVCRMCRNVVLYFTALYSVHLCTIPYRNTGRHFYDTLYGTGAGVNAEVYWCGMTCVVDGAVNVLCVRGNVSSLILIAQ